MDSLHYGEIYYRLARYLFQKVPEFRKKSLIRYIREKYGFRKSGLNFSINGKLKKEYEIFFYLQDNCRNPSYDPVWFREMQEKTDDEILLQILCIFRMLDYREYRYLSRRRKKMIKEIFFKVTDLNYTEIENAVHFLISQGIIRKNSLKLADDFGDLDLKFPQPFSENFQRKTQNYVLSRKNQ